MKNDNNISLFRKALRFTYKAVAIALTTAYLTACSATVKKSYFDDNPDVLNTDYTSAIVRTIKENFNNNPIQYSQELGNALLVQMHQKSPQFAIEMAKVPEVIDGINPKEAESLESILEIIKPINFTPDFYRNLDDGVNKVLLTVTNQTGKTLDWSGEFSRAYESFGSIPVASSVNFEPSDTIDHIFTGDSNKLNWAARLPPGDSDSILLQIEYPRDGLIVLYMGDSQLQIYKKEVKEQNKIEKELTNGGKLVIKDANMLGISPVKYGVRDIVLSGNSEYRYSSPLQALLWGYLDGHFKEGENPLKNYKGVIDFINPIWGNMESPRWKDFDTVMDRLNSPELVDHWINSNISYKRGNTQRSSTTFKRKIGQCLCLGYLGTEALKRAGYKTFLRHVAWGPWGTHDHGGGGIILDDGRYLLVIDFNPNGNKISGPYNDIKELDSKLSPYNKIIDRMWGTYFPPN